MMAMRTDSRGSPLQRSYCGNFDTFVQGQKMIQKRQQQKKTKERGGYLARLAANTVLQAHGIATPNNRISILKTMQSGLNADKTDS